MPRVKPCANPECGHGASWHKWKNPGHGKCFAPNVNQPTCNCKQYIPPPGEPPEPFRFTKAMLRDIEKSAAFLQHPKVQQARELLREAHAEILLQEKQRIDSMICECTHRHDQHAKSHSINYSAGVCLFCDCLHFLTPRT